MSDIKNLLFDLCKEASIGSVCDAAFLAEKHLSKYCDVKRDGNTIVGQMKGESDYKILLDAHIDEVGFIVTNVDSKGFLTLSSCGGIDLRGLSALPLIIHGKEKIKGVFCSTPPHLNSSDITFKNIADLKVDTLLGETAKNVVSVGDYVTFDIAPVCLLEDKITAKALDDRAGVVCLLELARRLKDKKLPVSVSFLISDMEELGTRGAKTATFNIDPNEAVAIDVSFGTAPDVSSQEAGELSKGAMVGISPVLDRAITNRLIEIAEKENIAYQKEVMSSRTGTNADVISVTKSGVRSGLLSIPLRNMHTSVEIVDMNDILSVCDILENYILSGGSR